ncbi:conserved hypothetical protein [Uncinocarpus reesii 1704]|uniref:Uncharacterized protein n=1 Tax=Uncinocarpus reesii (strain UAMH 1704) TaxID=336963 RepID=C4JYG4_UNCRE|nr:uncharacterized protein UREG_07215 [Uncinocarpus reesii 1704]EEP82350.1 conserved hypothetical protein [Uncinocarpus reesii 1704]
MKLIVNGGLSVSAVIRRQTTSSHYRALRRNTSTSTTSSQPTPAPKAADAAKSPTSQPHPHSSASASAGAALPSIPEASSRSLRQIIKASPLGQAVGWYSRQQHTRPYWTQMWSTLVIFFCADLCAQFVVPSDEGSQLEGEKDGTATDDVASSAWSRYDPLRTARHLTVGAVACIPVYRWFMFLHHHFNYASKGLSILTKVIVSQSVFTPTFNTYFFTMQSLLAGASLEDTWERVKKAVPNSVMNSLKLWPGVTAFLFLYVEPQFRSIVSGVVAVGWQTYLSWLNQKAAKEVREAAAIGAGDLLESPTPRNGAVLQPS